MPNTIVPASMVQATTITPIAIRISLIRSGSSCGGKVRVGVLDLRRSVLEVIDSRTSEVLLAEMDTSELIVCDVLMGGFTLGVADIGPVELVLAVGEFAMVEVDVIGPALDVIGSTLDVIGSTLDVIGSTLDVVDDCELDSEMRMRLVA